MEKVKKMNYQKELEKLIVKLEKEEKVPRLLLHSCCAPCSSYVLEYLSNYFDITIFPESEYTKRILEQQMLIGEMKVKYPISFVAGNYDREKFYELAKGLEHLKEGGERCFKCYALRLEETARMAKEAEFDYFTTTLTISPMKNAEKLNTIGVKIGEKYGVKYLQSDFKKKNGYKRSIELSNEFGLYRQDYCGCEFSVRDRKQESTGIKKK